MDETVKLALAKWPHVPHCFGWLGLDARGQWWMRDAAAQAQGAFSDSFGGSFGGGGNTAARGSLLRHEGLVQFIQRNYAADAAGRWFFQNGPQRVYVSLQAAPWVMRVADAGAHVVRHDGQPVRQVRAALLDECGRLYLDTSEGFGIVHTQDMLAAADAVQAGRWQPQDVTAENLPARMGYVLEPLPDGAT